MELLLLLEVTTSWTVWRLRHRRAPLGDCAEASVKDCDELLCSSSREIVESNSSGFVAAGVPRD